ncbi:MAG TPA: copper resistance CopC family protein [Dehalococcoidia bacterium]
MVVTRTVRAATAGAVALALLLVAAGPAAPGARAHAEYQRSEPPAGGVVREAPGRVDVWFTQELFRQAGANAIEVTGPDGTRADTGDVVLDDADRHHLSVGLRPGLPPGVYTVTWRNLSAEDGDPHAGSFTFTVDPAAAPTPSPGQAAPPQGAADGGGGGEAARAGDGGSGWLLPAALGGAVVAVAAGLAALLLRIRRAAEE